MDAALVVHLMSPGAAALRSGWDAPDGSARHVFVSWRDMPPGVAAADLVVAHGLGALVVAQTLADVGPGVVYVPTDAARPGRRRWHRRLRAAWIAAPNGRAGFAAAARLGLGQNRVVVVDDDDRVAWDGLVSSLLRDEPIDDDLLPVAPQRLGVLWSGLVRTYSRSIARNRRSRDRRSAEVPAPSPTVTVPDRSADGPPEPARPGPARPALPAAQAAAILTAPPAVVAAPPAVAAPDVEDLEVREADPDRPWAIGAAPRGRPATLASGVVDPSSPGHPWWRYRRVDVPAGTNVRTPSNGGSAARAGANAAAAAGPPNRRPPEGEPPDTPDPEPGGERRSPVQIVRAVTESGAALFAGGAAILAVVIAAASVGIAGESPVLIPIAGLLFTLSAGRRIARKHPGEEWLPRWLVWGLLAKLLACYLRYFTLTVTYGGGGDASDYDKNGRLLAHAWKSGTPGPVLPNLKEANFLRWFTGVVYYVFGANLLAGTFIFGLLALIGSYLWYRATADAVPIVDKRLYLGFVLFAPSIAFWPAEVGKEALMQLGLGTFALGTVFFLRQRFFPALMIAVPGGWLLWVVRPHLLAMVTIAAGAAYLAGRVRTRDGKVGLFSRPLGIVIIAFVVAFAVGQGAKFLGLPDLSLSSIQAELNQTTVQSSEGGSSFNNGGDTLNPVHYPIDAITVLIRPFPWETHGLLQLLASAEGSLLAVLMVRRFGSLRQAFRRSRQYPLLMFCIVLTALYCVAFSSFANFGLLVRERSLVLPAMLVLLAVDPTLAVDPALAVDRGPSHEGEDVDSSAVAARDRIHASTSRIRST